MKCNRCGHDMQIIEHNEVTTTMPESMIYKCRKCGNIQRVIL